MIDHARLTLANLRRQKLRTVLTVMGVVTGTASVTTMVSVGIGVKRSIIAPLDRAELLTSISVHPVKLDLGSFSMSDFGRSGLQKLRERKPLTDETVRELRLIPHVITAYPDLNVPVTVEVDGKLTVMQIDVLPNDGITPGLRDAIVAGAFWSESARGCVMPSSQLADLGIAAPAAAVGKTVVFRAPGAFFETQPGEMPSGNWKTIEVPIAGVYDSKKLGLAGSRIMLPAWTGNEVYRLAGRMGRMPTGEYRALTVKVDSLDHLAEVREAIDAMGYGTVTVTDIVGLIDWIFVGVEASLGMIGSVGLLVAFFGIANTMVMAVLERTREIGILKALGARDRDVRRIFFAEAAAIGLLGGGIGLLVSKGLGDLLDLIANQMVKQATGSTTELDLFQISGWLAGAAVGFALVTAVVAGAYPAWRAARLDPVDALRHD